MDQSPSPTPHPDEQSVAARIGAAIAAAVASHQFANPASKAPDKERERISFYVPAKMEKAFRYICIQLELREEALHDSQDILLEMLRAFLNFYATDKGMAHPILRSMKSQSGT